MNKLDNLFQEKLDTLESLPSFDAWNQIQDQLEEKKKPFVWYYVAASVVILLVAGVLVWNQSPEELTQEKSIAMTVPLVATPVSPIKPITVDEVVEKNAAPASNEAMTQPLSAKSLATEAEGEAESQLLMADVSLSIQLNDPVVHHDHASLTLDFYPMYVEDGKPDESKLKRAWEYAQRVKNGEANPLNLRKAKEDLFAFAKSKIKSEENINFD